MQELINKIIERYKGILTDIQLDVLAYDLTRLYKKGYCAGIDKAIEINKIKENK